MVCVETEKCTTFPVLKVYIKQQAYNPINANGPSLCPPQGRSLGRTAVWGGGVQGAVPYFLVFLCTHANRVLMAFLWSFTDMATLLSAVSVGGKEVSESVPAEPGDRLEGGEFLLRLPVSSLI